MSERVIITEEELHGKLYEILAVYQGNHMKEVRLLRENTKPLLGNIYIGRVQSIVSNIQAAFIEIAGGQGCFCPLSEIVSPVFTKKVGKKPLCQGDELLVEVVKEGVKTKPPMVSANLNFTGKYLVLTTQNRKLGISKKITGEERKRLKTLMEEKKGEDFGLVVRTNAAEIEEQVLLEELEKLKKEYEQLRQTSIHKTAFSLLREADSEEIHFLKGLYMAETEKITTDKPEIYERLQKYLSEHQPQDMEKLCLYVDKMVSLGALNNIKRELARALDTKVWLPSGGYLVIEPTEALTVIDVNSGRNQKKLEREELFFQTNVEAAKEIAAQLILRNISGICIIDFIDMKEKSRQEELMHILRMELKKDKIPATLVDITRLGLVELTRKKVQKSLREQLRGDEPYEYKITKEDTGISAEST